MKYFFRNRRTSRNAKAFTLIELVFVIGLAAIVFFLGIPSYNSFRQNRASAAAAMQFIMDVRKVRHLCIKLEQESIFLVNDYLASPPNRYSYQLPGESRTIRRDIQGEYTGARLDGAGGSGFKVTEGGEFSRDGVTDPMVPNSMAGSYNYMFVSFFGSTKTYRVRLFDNGQADLIEL